MFCWVKARICAKVPTRTCPFHFPHPPSQRWPCPRGPHIIYRPSNLEFLSNSATAKRSPCSSSRIVWPNTVRGKADTGNLHICANRLRARPCGCQAARLRKASQTMARTISIILCMPEKVSGGGGKFQGLWRRWNKWEGQGFSIAISAR